MSAEPSTHRMLADSVRRALSASATHRATVAAEPDGFDRTTWQRLRDLGLRGGDAAGLDLRELSAVVGVLGELAALVPFVDSEALARWAAKGAGLPMTDDETLAVVGVSGRRDDGAGVAGRVAEARVKWGRHADRLLVLLDEGPRCFACVVPRDALRFVPGSNVAAEPLDRCSIETVDALRWTEVPRAFGPSSLARRGALLRVAGMLGASTTLQSLTIQYASDRRQFGKSLSHFQVIQSQLAAMAGELAAMEAMFETALAAAEAAREDASWDGLEIAATKVRAGIAVQTMAGVAHQVHGAIGFTREYPLHLYSRRLWAWREEYGNDTYWSGVLGAALLSLGPEGFWRRIAR